MRFEEGPENYKFRIVAEGQEVEVFGAAYRELLDELARDKTEDEIGDFILYMAAWDDEDTKAFLSNDPGFQAKVLESFHARSKSAIVEMGLRSFNAPFNNMDMATRYTLGKKALEMAKMMRDSQHAVEQFPKELHGKALEDFIQGAVDETGPED